MGKIQDFIDNLDLMIARSDVDIKNIYYILQQRAIAVQALGSALGGNSGGLSQAELEESLGLVLPTLVNGKLPVDIASLNVTVDNAALEIANDAGNPIPVSYPNLLTRLGANGDTASHTGSEAAQLRQLADYLLTVTNRLPASIGSRVPVTIGSFSYATATSTNATTTVTLSAPGQGLAHVVKEVHFSTAGASLPAAGIPLTITANGSSYSLDVTNNGPGSIFLNIPGGLNASVVVTLGAGGASVVNKLIVAYSTI